MIAMLNVQKSPALPDTPLATPEGRRTFTDGTAGPIARSETCISPPLATRKDMDEDETRPDVVGAELKMDMDALSSLPPLLLVVEVGIIDALLMNTSTVLLESVFVELDSEIVVVKP